MSDFDQQKAKAIFNRRMGYNESHYDLGLRNQANKQILNELDHNDLGGIQSKIFSQCFQNVREKVGFFKLFGSRENTMVTSCVQDHADAWQKTLQELEENN